MASLSDIFSKVVKGGAILAITEIFIFTLVHANTGGMALMSAIAPGINSFFDMLGITDLMYGASEVFGGGPAEIASGMGGELVAGPDGGSVLDMNLNG